MLCIIVTLIPRFCALLFGAMPTLVVGMFGLREELPHAHGKRGHGTHAAILPFLCLSLILICGASLSAATGQLEVTVIDKDTGKQIPCRMHLLTAKGQPRRIEKVPYWNDHFALPGKLMLKLPLGNYNFVLERGLEYLDQSGNFTINVFADDSKQIELRRFVDMAAEGWYSGDLDIRRPAGEIELLMQADDLHLGEVVTWINDKPPPGNKPPTAKTSPLPLGEGPGVRAGPVTFDGNRCYSLLAGEQSGGGDEIAFHRLAAPLKLAGADKPTNISRLREGEAPAEPNEATRTGPATEARQEPRPPGALIQDVIEAKKQKHAWIDVANPASWDMPTLVALNLVDSIQVASSRLCRDKLVTEDAGKPRDKKRFPDPTGLAGWSQEIYFRLLQCGLRIPPTAGSGSGTAPNPVGYNRAYVNIEGEFSYESWWDGLCAGRVFITNGPLLRVSTNGEPPGHVFAAANGVKLELEVALTLSTREEIHYLEFIKNGAVAQSIRMDQYIENVKNNKLPKIEFDESGWFLVRAVCDSAKTYHFAMTGPYYVTIGDQPCVSKKAAQFFLDWVDECAKQIKLDDPAQQKEVLEYHRQARDYWKKLVETANAE